MRSSEFYFPAHSVYLNHGSFGAIPRAVFEDKMRLSRQVEEAPDAWYRWRTESLWNHNRNVLANFLGARPENMTFVANATTGCNAVLKSLEFSSGDALLTQTFTYQAIKNTCRAAMHAAGGVVVELDLPLRVSSAAEIIQLYTIALTTYPNIRLVLLDCISGPSTIRFPLSDLIRLCRKHDKLVLVDGAHAPGQLPLNLDQLQAHFFIGNLHKWMFTGRGCGVLWVHPDYHDVIKPVVTANNYESCSLNAHFFTQGTIDYTTVCTVERAIQFFNDIGGHSQVGAYCSGLVDDAAGMLVQSWGTEQVPACKELQSPHMRLVRVPYLPSHDQSDLNDMPTLVKLLACRYGISVSAMTLQGSNWIRLSASIYNSLSDYETLREAVSHIIETPSVIHVCAHPTINSHA